MQCNRLRIQCVYFAQNLKSFIAAGGANTYFGWGLRRTNTVKVILLFSTFTSGGGRPQVPLRALFQARASTREEVQI